MILACQIVALTCGALAAMGGIFGETVSHGKKGLWLWRRLNNLGRFLFIVAFLAAAASGYLLYADHVQRESQEARRHLRRQLACVPLRRALDDYSTGLYLLCDSLGLALPELPIRSPGTCFTRLIEDGLVEELVRSRPDSLRLANGMTAKAYFDRVNGALLECIRSIIESRVDDFSPEELSALLRLQSALESPASFPCDNSTFFFLSRHRELFLPDGSMDEDVLTGIHDGAKSHARRLDLVYRITEYSFSQDSPLIPDQETGRGVFDARMAYDALKPSIDRFWERHGRPQTTQPATTSRPAD